MGIKNLLKLMNKKGDLVKWTFRYSKINSTMPYSNPPHIGILVHPEELPEGSWVVLLDDGSLMQADKSELEIINEKRTTK